MEASAWRTRLVICISLLVMAYESPLVRLPGAEARGRFCCPRMVNCSLVCHGFPSRCVNCKCICGVEVVDASPPMAGMYFGNHQQLD
ncbi:hypothetical protein HRI_004127300 [Hibiscus trionum]|nr:hypothetical protein HRI_004127300 [Hibiscus trionum]